MMFDSLGPLVTKIPTASLGSLIDKLSSLRTQNATGNSVRSPLCKSLSRIYPVPFPVCLCPGLWRRATRLSADPCYLDWPAG